MNNLAKFTRISEYVTACHPWNPLKQHTRHIVDKFTVPVWYLDYDGVQVFVFETERENILVFQGSRSIKDWLRNFNYFMSFENEPVTGYYHKGFHNAAMKCCIPIVKVINDLVLCNSPKKTIVTGHSHGAALATISTPYIHGRPEVILFGSPYVCDKQAGYFIENHASKFIRITNNVDIVTWLNKTLTDPKPAGVGREYQIAATGDLRIKVPTAGLPWRQALQSLFEFNDKNMLWGHLPSAYTRRLIAAETSLAKNVFHLRRHELRETLS